MKYDKYGGINYENNEDLINSRIHMCVDELKRLERECGIDITVMTSWKYKEPHFNEIDTEVLIDNLTKKDELLNLMNFYVDYRNDKWFCSSGERLLYLTVDDLKDEYDNIKDLENQLIFLSNNTVRDIDNSFLIEEVI